MILASDPSVVAGTRVVTRQQVIELGDGHRLGVHVAGAGVPVVFLHGIGLTGAMYSDLLGGLPQFGFLTVAPDAAGYGGTAPLADHASFHERARFLDRALDELGIRRAVLIGHSMGGRNVIELAVMRPDRVIAAVLLNAAAGHTFDQVSRRAALRLPTLIAAFARARWDARSGSGYLSAEHKARYRRLKRIVSRQAFRNGIELHRTARAIAHAGETTPMLEQLRALGIPTVVAHGTHDLVVPVESGLDCARSAEAALYLLPHVHHSWMLPDPWLATELIEDLLHAELGAAIAATAAESKLPARPTVADWHSACLDLDARVLELASETELATEPMGRYYGPAMQRAVRVEIARSALTRGAS